MNRMIPHDQAMPALPFDQHNRYQMMREALDATREEVGPRLRVLDVGGFFRQIDGTPVLPAQLFLPDDDVTVLDQRTADLPGYVQGDGRSLQFADQSFDFVVSCDTLEHVPAADRPAFWRELLRVARCGVLLAAPFDLPEVVAAEELLLRYVKATLGVEQPELCEHRDYGLPNRVDTYALLDTLGLEYRDYPASHVHSWLCMMLIRHYLSIQLGQSEMLHQLDQYYLRFLSASERRDPAYRRLWLVAQPEHHTWLSRADAALSPTIQTDAATQEPLRAEFATWLFQLFHIQLANQHNHALHTLLHSLSDQTATDGHMAQTLQHVLAQREQQVADLEQRATWLQEQAEAAQHELQAIKRGRIMQLLGRVSRLLGREQPL